MEQAQSEQVKTVAIAGLCGKSTVKALIEAVLRRTDAVLITSDNAPITGESGLESQIVLREWATVKQGQISEAIGAALPSVSVVTCSGADQLADIPLVDSIAQAQGQVYDALSDTGVAVINYDDQFAPQWMKQVNNKRTLTFSIYNTKPADVLLSQARYIPGKGSRLSIKTPRGQIELQTQLLGEHQWSNVLAAVASVLPFDVDLEDIANGVASVLPNPGCLRLRPVVVESWVMIDDTVSATPLSVRAAIDVLATCKGRRVLVLGSMTACDAQNGYRKIGQYARRRMIDDVIAVGESAEQVRDGFGAGQAFKAVAQVVNHLNTLRGERCTLLVKGACGTRLGEVLDAFAS